MRPGSIEQVQSFDFAAGVVLNVDKPSGWTSFAVVDRIKKWTGCKKVGHAGTLDPSATGVLLVCTGSATKRVSELMDLEKEYEGVIELGKSTDTDDGEGRVLEERDVPRFSEDEIRRALKAFGGSILQIPPMYSAIKQNGQRLYKLARKGKVVPREPRRVHIAEIVLLEWKHPCVHVRVRCSKGTYIRSVARDLGAELGTGGYLYALRRTRVGPYRDADSISFKVLRETFAPSHASV